MKVYKKSVLLLGLAMLSSGIIAEIPEEEERLAAEKLEIEQFFPAVEKEKPEWMYEVGKPGVRHYQSKEEIIDEFIGARATLFADPETWILVLHDVYRYVEENAHGNSKLMTTAHLVREAGTLLSMQLHFPTPGFIPELSKYEEKLQKKANILEATTFYINKKNKYDAGEVLREVINFLLPHIEMVVGN